MVERGGLEIRCTALLYRGFESLSFRRIKNKNVLTGNIRFRKLKAEPDIFYINLTYLNILIPDKIHLFLLHLL